MQNIASNAYMSVFSESKWSEIRRFAFAEFAYVDVVLLQQRLV